MTAPLEIATLSPETQALRIEAAPLVFFALVIAVIAVFLRLAVGQSSRRSIAPAVVVIIAALVLAGAYVMSQGLIASNLGAVR
jgi:ribose transport system permease protein